MVAGNKIDDDDNNSKTAAVVVSASAINVVADSSNDPNSNNNSSNTNNAAAVSLSDVILPNTLILPPTFYISCSQFFRYHVSQLGTSYFHPVGTCPMPRKDLQYNNNNNNNSKEVAIVDDELRVKGVHNLRIADASVIPAIPSCSTAKICMIIGLRCADLIHSQQQT